MIEDTNSFLQKLAHAWNKCLILVKKDCSKEVFKVLYQNLTQYCERFGKHGLSCIFMDTFAFANQLKKAKQWNSVNPADYVPCAFPNLPSISCVSGQTLRNIIEAGNYHFFQAKENIPPNPWRKKVQDSHFGNMSEELSGQTPSSATTSVIVTEPLNPHKGFKAKSITSNTTLNSRNQNILSYFGKANGKKKLESVEKFSQSDAFSGSSHLVDNTTKKDYNEHSLQAWSLDMLLEDRKCADHENVKDGPPLKIKKKSLTIRKTITDHMFERKETGKEPVSKEKYQSTNERDVEVDHDSFIFTPDRRKTSMLEKNVSCESKVKSCSLPLFVTTVTKDNHISKNLTSHFSSTKYEPFYTRCDSDSSSSLSSTLSPVSSSSLSSDSFKSEDSLPSLLLGESDQSSYFKDEDNILDNFTDSEIEMDFDESLTD